MHVSRLPLFPLGVVLFPGVRVPLHLFEPRYRQMLANVQQGDRRFGIIRNITGVADAQLPPGRVGCVAEVTAVDLLPDGRSDIVVVGRERFALRRLLPDDALYHVAAVDIMPDTVDASPLAVMLMADEVVARFRSVVAAVRILNRDTRDLPALPDDPAQLAYTIASMMELTLDDRQALLAERSPAARLATIDTALRRLHSELEIRTAVPQRT